MHGRSKIIAGNQTNLSFSPGYERIPDNWYTRARGDEYTIPFLSLDSNLMALQHPEFLSVGGNTGKVNSFVGLDPANLTNGVFNAGTLRQGNNAICYGLELSLMETPDLLSGLYSVTTTAMAVSDSAFSTATTALGCPKLNAINKGQFNQFPGYTALKSNGAY